MLFFPVGMLWTFKTLSNHSITDRSLCTFRRPLDCLQTFLTFPVLVTSIYPGIFAAVGVFRSVWGLRNVYLKWSQTVRDKEFLVEMRLRNLEPEENKEKTEEKKEEQEQEEAAVRDLPVLDLIENESDGESDNEEERFLL
jgi:hypothetical protein